MSTNLNVSKDLDTRVGEIRRWMTLGPFAAEAKGEEFISPYAIDPNKIYDHDGRKLKWESWYVNDECPASYQFSAFVNHSNFNTNGSTEY